MALGDTAKLRVLVVEDETLIAIMIEEAFAELGPVDKPVLAPVQPERLGRCGHGMTR